MDFLISAEYTQVLSKCKQLFADKNKDYGASWRIFRMPSITDQLFIKAQRIRSIQEKKTQQIADSIEDEFMGIINYSIIAQIQLELGVAENDGLPKEIDGKKLDALFDLVTTRTLTLLSKKNHDYGEAWRDMRITSITDIILVKLLRIKNIENHFGKTTVSEGVLSNYQDIMNYAIFCLIKMQDKSTLEN